MIAATRMSTPVASQIGRKRAATMVLATNDGTRPLSPEVTSPTDRPGVLTDCRIQCGQEVKGTPRPDVHSEQMGSKVSTMGERRLARRTPGRSRSGERLRHHVDRDQDEQCGVEAEDREEPLHAARDLR